MCEIKVSNFVTRSCQYLGIADAIICELITSKWLSNLLVAEVVISDSILSRYIAHYLLHI